MRLHKAIQQFLDSQVGVFSPATQKWYAQRLKPLKPLYDKSLKAITARDPQCLWGKLAKNERWDAHPNRPAVRGGLSPYTLHGYARAWRAFFKWGVQQDYLSHNPATLLKQPPLPEQPPKALLPDDLTRLLSVARADLRDYAIVCFLADTGCRVGGLVGLRLADLNLETGRAVVWEKGRGGGRKSRTVYMKACTVEALRVYLCAYPCEAEARVFQGQRGPLTTSGVYQLLKRLARKAQITGRHNPHAFRHGFARGALQNGADLGTVAQLLGHCDVTITVRFYARWADDELKAKHTVVSWPPEEGSRVDQVAVEGEC